MSGILSKQDIIGLLGKEPPLVEGCPDLEKQLQPNGIDLTLREVSMFQTPGQIGVSNSERRISSLGQLMFDSMGYIELISESYLITYNETVNLPNNVMALALPRSSLLRCGVTIHTAVWDAGYSGRAQSLMVVFNSRGFRLQRNARIVQLVFFQLTQETEGYKGIYLGENT